MDYVKYFEPLEKAREAGRTDEALFLSQKALLDAAKENDPVLAINALGHQLLIFKDQFTKTGSEFYLHLMHGVTAAGLQLAQDLGAAGQPVAVMHLRAGDYFFHCRRYPEAVKAIALALESLGEIQREKPGEYSEYLSHLGKAKVFAGQVEGGLKDLQESIVLAEGSTELRDFHQKIVYSGNLARLALCYMKIGHNDKAKELARIIQPIALDLKDNYNMPLRWQELDKALKQSGLSWVL